MLNSLALNKRLGRTRSKWKTTFALLLSVIILLFFLNYHFAGLHYKRFTNRTSRNCQNHSVQRYSFSVETLLTVPNRKLSNNPKLKEVVLPDRKFFVQDRNVKDVNCKAIINGDGTETNKASNKSASKPRESLLSPMDYMNLTSNCEKFIAKRGYVMSSLTQIETDFAIAFSVLMYKDVEQAERLLRAIYRPQNVYCIHVDNKTDNDIFKAMEGIANCFNNVFMARTRIDVRWGKYSVLEPDLICMEDLLQRNKKWKYFINLTGQEFPLRTNYEMVRILMAYNGANDIQGTIKRSVSRGTRQAIFFLSYECLSLLLTDLNLLLFFVITAADIVPCVGSKSLSVLIFSSDYILLLIL